MGFLKRIFSIGSKKHKKRPQIVHNVDAKLRALEEEEHEAAIGRLLRSSSARYTVVSEVDYASLPPLPHPINEVIHPPSVSTISLASSTISQRGTYTVTVHGRKQDPFSGETRDRNNDETLLQHPHSNPELNDTSNLLGLRSDPSVVSLLEMYDEHGQIAADAFSNSPPSQRQDGRAQTRRTGSTLRQLLGNPTSSSSKDTNESGLGDISWAERFLGENTSGSSSCSSDLRTPISPDAHFQRDALQCNNAHYDFSLSTDHDLSMYENPAISSMEVELSISESFRSVGESCKDRHPYGYSDATTPRRASQIFGFLAERRQSQFSMDPAGKRSQHPPSAFSTSDHGSPSASGEHSHFSDDSVDGNPVPHSALPRPCFDISGSSTSDDHPICQSSAIPILEMTCPVVQTELVSSAPLRDLHDNRVCSERHETVNQIKVIMTAPTKVIVTAPTPSYKLETSDRVPRGPRTQSRRLAPGNNQKRSTELVERSDSCSSQSHDSYTPAVSRRTSSHSSSSISGHVDIGRPITLVGKDQRRASGTRSIVMGLNKENGYIGKQLSAQHKSPLTPLRAKSDSKSLFRAAVNPGTFHPPRGMTPSPVSSSELSPVGRQLMMSIREQRSKAREADRTRHGSRGVRR